MAPNQIGTLRERMSGFFAVGLAEWRAACALGLNPAASFLVLACGTGRDNQTTAWSANAVQEYGGISWIRAKPAIEVLEKAGLLERAGKSTVSRPRYKLKISEEKIWLPKSIVVPLAGEMPVIARIRQAQDVMTLRLFVELYYSQNLAADGGLSRSVYYEKYKKTLYCERGNFMFLGFDSDTSWVSWSTEVTRAHQVSVSKQEQSKGKTSGEEFFRRIGTLRDLGLLELSACLFESESDEAEMLFPIDGPTEDEKAVGHIAEAAVNRVLPDWQVENNPHRYLIPVYRHQGKAELYGIFRLRHRPHTKMTGAWWATLQSKIDAAVEMINTIGR